MRTACTVSILLFLLFSVHQPGAVEILQEGSENTSTSSIDDDLLTTTVEEEPLTTEKDDGGGGELTTTSSSYTKAHSTQPVLVARAVEDNSTITSSGVVASTNVGTHSKKRDVAAVSGATLVVCITVVVFGLIFGVW